MTEQPADKPKKQRLHRIVKWTVLSTSAVVLWLATYISLWCCWLWHQQTLIARVIPGEAFMPLHEYASSSLAGSDRFYTVAILSRSHGEWTWRECRAYMRHRKHSEPLEESHPFQRDLDRMHATPSPSTATSPTPDSQVLDVGVVNGQEVEWHLRRSE